MAHPALDQNPFMLMMHPEVVVAAMEKSERLRELKRQLCRPLDRPVPAGSGAGCLDDETDDPALSGRAAGC